MYFPTCLLMTTQQKKETNQNKKGRGEIESNLSERICTRVVRRFFEEEEEKNVAFTCLHTERPFQKKAKETQLYAFVASQRKSEERMRCVKKKANQHTKRGEERRDEGGGGCRLAHFY